MARFERQRGIKSLSEMPSPKLHQQFLGNVTKVYNLIGAIVLCVCCVGMGFVFWADNYKNNPSPPNNATMFSIIDSVFLTTSAFTNSGLASAALYNATLGTQVLVLLVMLSYAPCVYECALLLLYRRRIAGFIRQVISSHLMCIFFRTGVPVLTLTWLLQHVESYEWAEAAEEL